MNIPNAQLYLSAACLCGAILLTAWSLFHGIGLRALPGCRTDSRCHAVTRGRWSRLGPVPVAGIGLGVYLLLLAALFCAAWSADSPSIRFLKSAAAFLAWCSVDAAVWFTLIQGLVIRHWCIYCVLTHFLAGVASCIVLFDSGAANVAHPGALALAAVTALVAGQLLFEPRRFALVPVSAPEPSMERAESKNPPQAPPVSSVPASAGLRLEVHPPKHRSVVLAAGRMSFDLFDFPLLGSPDAPTVMAAFVDFTCGECHHLHRILREAVDHFSGRLAVSLIPIPLHEGCNPTAKCHREEQAYACNYARVAWRLWMADKMAYQVWDEFILSEPAEPRPFGLAIIKAKELADIGPFRVNEPDPIADSRIAAGVVLYQAATMPTVPALVLEAGIVQGHVPNLDGLLELISPHLLPSAAANDATIGAAN